MTGSKGGERGKERMEGDEEETEEETEDYLPSVSLLPLFSLLNLCSCRLEAGAAVPLQRPPHLNKDQLTAGPPLTLSQGVTHTH